MDELHTLDIFLHLAKYLLWLLVLSKIRNYHLKYLKDNSVKLAKQYRFKPQEKELILKYTCFILVTSLFF